MRKFLVCWVVLSFISLTAFSPAVGGPKEDEASGPSILSARPNFAPDVPRSERRINSKKQRYLARMARKLQEDVAWRIIDQWNERATKASTFADAYAESLLKVPFSGLRELGGGLQARATGLVKGGCRQVLSQHLPGFGIYDFCAAWGPLVQRQWSSLRENPLPGFEGFGSGLREEMRGYIQHPVQAMIEWPEAMRELWIDAKADLWPSLKTTFTKEALAKAGVTETGLILVNYALVHLFVNSLFVHYLPVIDTPVVSIPVGSMLVSSLLMHAMPVNYVPGFVGYVKHQGSSITGGLETLLAPFARETKKLLRTIWTLGRGLRETGQRSAIYGGGVGFSFHP